MSRLEVGFLGHWRVLDASDTLTFGRRADLDLDTSRHLEPTAGRFESRNGSWWIVNDSIEASLRVLDGNSPSSVHLSPGSACPFWFGDGILRVETVSSVYELELRQSLADSPGGTDPLVSRREVSLNDEQRLLLAVLSEAKLRDPDAALDLPTNAEAATRLQWSLTKLNRKLDHLCMKFERLGVPGLRGSVDRLASNRRQRLVEHCLAAGLITPDDLPEGRPEAC